MIIRKAPFAAVGLVTCLGLACSDDVTGIGAADLVGSWQVTRADFINPTNSAQHVDVIAGGATMSLAFDAGGRYVLTYTELGGAPQTEVGDWSIESAKVVLRPDPDPDPPIRFSAELAQGRVTLTTTDAEHDLDGDGRDDPARLVLVLERP